MLSNLKAYLMTLFFTPKTVGSLVRHALTSVAAVLVAYGWLDSESREVFIGLNSQALTGLLMWLGGWLMSLKEKTTRGI